MNLKWITRLTRMTEYLYECGCSLFEILSTRKFLFVSFLFVNKLINTVDSSLIVADSVQLLTLFFLLCWLVRCVKSAAEIAARKLTVASIAHTLHFVTKFSLASFFWYIIQPCSSVYVTLTPSCYWLQSCFVFIQ